MVIKLTLKMNQSTFLKKLAYALAWILLFSPPFLIRGNGKEVGYTLLAAFFFYPLAQSRKALAIFAPLLIFIGAANIFHAQFLGNMIDEFSVATLLRTEVHEATEFLGLINHQMIFVLLCWLVASCGCSYFLFKQCGVDQEPAFQNWKKKTLLGIGLLWCSFFAFGVTQQFTANDYVHKLRHIYPMHMVKASMRYADLEKDVFYQPKLPPRPVTAQVNTLVVVIGESASSHRWSLLGYQAADTNQSLHPISGLRTYKVMANGFNTAKALPYILTGQSAFDSQKNASPSFLDLAQHAGYKTFVFSNSRFNDKSEDMYSQILRRSADVYAKVGNGAHDEVMTSWLEKSLADEAPYKLVVLHTYGSHPDITKRYPRSLYPEGDSYDNSIRYTSDLLANWIRMVDAASDKPSAVLYVSDHGLGIPPCVDSPRQGNDQSVLEVPLVYWGNAAMRHIPMNEGVAVSDKPMEHSTTLAPEILVTAQGYNVRTAMPHLQDSRKLYFEGESYADLYRNDFCTP